MKPSPIATRRRRPALFCHRKRLLFDVGAARGFEARRNSSLFPSSEIYLDAAYAKELRRRAAVLREMSGQDFVAVVDDLVKEGRDQQALANPMPPSTETGKH